MDREGVDMMRGGGSKWVPAEPIPGPSPWLNVGSLLMRAGFFLCRLGLHNWAPYVPAFYDCTKTLRRGEICKRCGKKRIHIA